MESPALSELIGTNILARVPALKPNDVVSVRLLAVENGGIWIESQEFMDEMFDRTPHTMSAKTVAIFVPYAQIVAIYTTADTPWISRKVTA